MDRAIPWVLSYTMGFCLFIAAYAPDWESSLLQNMAIAACLLAGCSAWAASKRLKPWPTAIAVAGMAGLVTPVAYFLLLVAVGAAESH